MLASAVAFATRAVRDVYTQPRYRAEIVFLLRVENLPMLYNCIMLVVFISFVVVGLRLCILYGMRVVIVNEIVSFQLCRPQPDI